MSGSIHFSILDISLLAAFILFIFATAAFTKSKGSGFIEYFAAGRSLSLPAMVATLVATWYGGILGVGESVSYYGIGTWLLIGVPYYLFAIIYAVTLAGKVRSSDSLTIPERLGAKFGDKVGTAGSFYIFLLATPAAQVYMIGVLLHLLTGWSMVMSIFVCALSGILFLWKGGLLTDVRIGVVAFIAVYIGFIVIDVVCLQKTTLPHLVSSLPSPALRKVDGGQGILAVISFFILGSWTLVDPGFHQRVSSSSAPGVAKRGVLVAVCCFVVFDLLTITAGLFAIRSLQPLPADHVAIFPIFAQMVLPSGLKAIFFMGLIGICISALSGYAFVSGATIGIEIQKRFESQIKPANATRLGLIISSVTAALIALWVHSVLTIWYTWSGVLVGGLLYPVLVSYYDRSQWIKKRSEPNALFIGMIAAFLVGIGWMTYGMRTDNPDLNVSVLEQSFSLGTLLPSLCASLISTELASRWILWKRKRDFPPTIQEEVKQKIS